MVNNIFKPDIGWVAPGWSHKTANKYDKTIEKEIEIKEQEEMKKKEQEVVVTETEEIVKNQKIQNISNIIKEAIYNPNLIESPYQFTKEEVYTDTDRNEMDTDTYSNMNTSLRSIRYNVGGAGKLYNQLSEGNNFGSDSPKKVFEALKNRFVELWYNKKINEEGKLENFDIQDDKDMLYVIWFFQTITEKTTPNASEKDFRVWDKTLKALLDDNNRLNYTEAATTKAETPVVEEEIATTNIDTETNTGTITTPEWAIHIEEKEQTEEDKKQIQVTYPDWTTVTTPKLTTSKMEKVTNEWEDIIITYENGETVKILWKYKDKAIVTEQYTEAGNESNTPQQTINWFVLPKISDIYDAESISRKPELINEYLFTLTDIETRGIKNIEYIPLIYKSLEIESDIPDAEEAKYLKEFIWLRMQQIDRSISQLKSGITISTTLGTLEDGTNTNPEFTQVEQDENGNLIVKFTDKWIEEILTEKNKNGENLYTRNGKFIKEIKVGDKSYNLEFSVWDPQMKRIYNTGRLDTYTSITPDGLRYLWVKGLFNNKDDDFTIKYPETNPQW